MSGIEASVVRDLLQFLSSTEALEFDLGSEQASNSEGTAAGRRGEGELIEKF